MARADGEHGRGSGRVTNVIGRRPESRGHSLRKGFADRCAVQQPGACRQQTGVTQVALGVAVAAAAAGQAKARQAAIGQHIG